MSNLNIYMILQPFETSTSKITSSLSTAQLISNPLPLIINYISILQFIYLYYNKDNSSSSNSNQPSIAFLISLLLSIILVLLLICIKKIKSARFHHQINRRTMFLSSLLKYHLIGVQDLKAAISAALSHRSIS